uniref:Uncharacterized protein n=1 Tax=Physcomitrium patens TaxID=3218 RepID=A0A7I4EZS3_PHYPA
MEPKQLSHYVTRHQQGRWRGMVTLPRKSPLVNTVLKFHGEKWLFVCTCVAHLMQIICSSFFQMLQKHFADQFIWVPANASKKL